MTTLKTMLENAESEIKSLELGRKASLTRARKSLQNIKTVSHNLRKEITAHTKSLPTKSRTKKTVEPGSVQPEPTEPVVEPVKKRVTRPKKSMLQE